MTYPHLLARLAAFVFAKKEIEPTEISDPEILTQSEMIRKQIDLHHDMLLFLEDLNLGQLFDPESKPDYSKRKAPNKYKQKVYYEKCTLQNKIRRELARLKMELTHLSKEPQ